MEKLKSRKFWLTMLTNIVTLATLFLNMSNTNVQIVAILIIAVSNTVYSAIEGNIDAKAVVTKIKETAEQIEEKL